MPRIRILFLLAAVPSGSMVEVCPGTYPEQVVISKPLTLEGITIGNADQAVITVPNIGLRKTHRPMQRKYWLRQVR